MQLLIFLLFTFFSPVHALDTGDGSDGACIWLNETLTQSVYNCTSLDITGTNTFDPSVTAGVFIKVQGDVEINGELNLGGNLRIGGPGGHNGGLGAALDGQDGSFPAGVSTARGRAGDSSIAGGSFNSCYGAGGSGGRHSSASTITAAVTITNVAGCDPITANGGGAPTGSYGNPLQFHTQIRGGAGGGSGGGADDDVTQEDGGNGGGGGGGGSLKLYAGGDLFLRTGAVIDLTGADGNGTTDGAGAGGGGAGGAVLVSVLGNIELEAGSLIDVSGGDAGLATGPGGSDGTAGGVGRIRLEDDDGTILGADGTTAPGASFGLNPTAAAAGGSGTTELNLQSDISAGCAVRENHSSQNFTTLFIFFLLILLAFKTKANKSTCSRVSK